MPVGARRAERLRAIANAYLRPRVQPALSLVVAGSASGLPSVAIGRQLLEAAESIDCRAELWLPEQEAEPSRAEGPLALRIFVFGALDASSVRRLPAPRPGMGPDLLLYALCPRIPQPLAELYTLSLWSWALDPRRTRCLLPAAQEGGQKRLRAQWSGIEGLPKVEILGWPNRDGASIDLCRQILQSVLAAGPRSRSAAAGATQD